MSFEAQGQHWGPVGLVLCCVLSEVWQAVVWDTSHSLQQIYPHVAAVFRPAQNWTLQQLQEN